MQGPVPAPSRPSPASPHGGHPPTRSTSALSATPWTHRCDACRCTQPINQLQSHRVYGVRWSLCASCVGRGCIKEVLRSTMQR